MIKTGLEFAPGTTEATQALIARLFTPEEILGAYREASAAFGTKDIVLTALESNPDGFNAEPRKHYAARLKRHLSGQGASTLAIVNASAQQIVKLPEESDALWLVLVRHQDLPVTTVIYVTPYYADA